MIEGVKILMMDMLEGEIGEVVDVKFDVFLWVVLFCFMWVDEE